MAMGFFHLERIHPTDMSAYESWNFGELSRYDKEELGQRYGRQMGANTPDARQIEEVRTLTGYEQDFFNEQDFVSPHFCIQFLYKIGSRLTREALREGVQALFRFVPELRVNFCPLGVDQRRHKVVFREVMPKIRYLSLNVLPDALIDNALQRIMAEERNHGFDWETEPLMRLTHIGMKGEDCAVLVTISRLLAPAWKESDFFTWALTCPPPSKGCREDFLNGKEASSVFDYWAPRLEELPPLPKLPGYRPDGPRSARKVYRSSVDARLKKVMEGISHGSREMLVTILHTAWGLLQRHVSFGRETCFCLLMPHRSLRLDNAAMAAETVFPVPMRLLCDNDWSMKEIVGRQMRQMLMSQAMTCRRMKELLEDFGQLPEDLPFRLHFHSFLQNTPKYGDLAVGKGGGLLDMSSWDAQQTALTLSFGSEGSEIYVEFCYNPYRVEPYSAELLAGAFGRVLQLLLACWDQKFLVFDKAMKAELGAWGNPFSKLGFNW